LQNPFVSLKALQTLEGPWSLSFDSGWGPKETLTLNQLNSWSEHTNALVKYYSGTATYRTSFGGPRFVVAAGRDGRDGAHPSSPIYLDLGNVEVMARVKVNSKDCGIVWKPPYRVEISNAIRNGQNELEIEVVNTWVNRMVGDEQLPLDSEWKDWETLLSWPDWFKQGGRSPSGRTTFTTARHYNKNSPLQPSGLLGPVTLQVPARVPSI
jgi:hypothetical protein